jgi:UDP-glucose 4-epimerase
VRILLTGSSGWLGRFLAPRLRNEGHDVVGLDVAPGADTEIVGSVADKALVDRALHGIDAVVHAGALHKPDIARYPERAFHAVNVEGTRHLLAAAAAAGADRFIFTSTTSLMISAEIRSGPKRRAVWLTEDSPAAPRNIYGVTKLAAEQLCRRAHDETGLAVLVLRAGRFFPEEDDTHRDLAGENRKANEFLGRRLTVEDAAEAHLAALVRAPALGFASFLLAAPTPFVRADRAALIEDAPAAIARHYPQAAALYAARGWSLPAHIERIYDPSRAERRLGFRCRTDFGAVLRALANGGELPFAHDPSYVSPVTLADGYW